MKKKGFTLIELLIVVAIIAILAAIAVPNFLEAQVRSKVSRTKADVRSLTTGLEAYTVDWNKYPPGGAEGSLYVSRLMRLQPLTTPQAYLTSVFPDVFNNKNEDGDVESVGPGAGRSIPKAEQRVLVYWPPVILDSWLFNDTMLNTAFEELPQEHYKKNNWMLLSFGPDQIFDINDGPWASTINVYDPTNGTVSRGDIIRTHEQTY